MTVPIGMPSPPAQTSNTASRCVSGNRLISFNTWPARIFEFDRVLAIDRQRLVGVHNSTALNE